MLSQDLVVSFYKTLFADLLFYLQISSIF